MSKENKQIPDAKDVYRQAVRFQLADFMIRKSAVDETENVQNNLMMPSMVLSAFSSELFLKCLLLLEEKPSVETHRLNLLFGQLRDETKSIIRKQWSIAVATNERELIENEKKLGITIPRDLDTALQDCGGAFVLLRYVYEAPNDAKFYIIDLPQVLREVIDQLTPEWK